MVSGLWVKLITKVAGVQMDDFEMIGLNMPCDIIKSSIAYSKVR